MVEESSQLDDLARLERVATRIPPENEFDRFAAYAVESGGITEADWGSIRAEDDESQMTFRPEGGVMEGHYRRLGRTLWQRATLAKAVLVNLLRKRGHRMRAIVAAFRDIDEESLPALVEEHSFERMAAALELNLKVSGGTNGAVEGRASRSAPSPNGCGPNQQIAVACGGQVKEGLGPAIRAIADRLDELRLDDRLSSIQDDLATLIRRCGAGAPRYVTIEEVASVTGLSDSHVRRAIRSGDLPAANMGAASKPRWLVALEDLEGWIGRRKGGAPMVPPRSEMKDLIERHLPGL